MSKPITPDVTYLVKPVADPSLTGDGKQLAYALSWVEPESLEVRSRIHTLDLDTGDTREFTQGMKDSVPRFSPDGSVLAFVRPDGKDVRQIWLINSSGGEARRITNAPKGVSDLRWSPDGRKLVYCADAEPDGPGETGDSSGLPKVKVVNRVRYRYDTLGWRGDSHYHLFLVDVDGGPAFQLTDGDWDDSSPVWSPDGSRIAFISQRRENRDFRALSEAFVLTLDGGEPEMWSEGLVDVGALTWSPDGRRLVAAGSTSPEGMVFWQAWLYVLEPGQPPVCLTDDSVKPVLGFPPLVQPSQLSWSDEGMITFLGDRKGETFVYRVPAQGGECVAVAGGNCRTPALVLDRESKAGVVLSASPGSPGDLYQLGLSGRNLKQLTHHNQDYLSEHPPAAMEKLVIHREGFDVECRLWLPPDFDATRKYPLILDIHGGPNGSFYDAFEPMQQVLATAGYLVLAVNPRGSSTYGDDFMMAVLGDWGGEDYLDLMAALDQVCQRPYVDDSRLGVHGYSYGGYMASWIVGHTNRMRAAVVGAPCINLYSMYGTSDIGISFGESQWGGGLDEAAGKMLERSPLTYAAQVDTPVLLMHGEADARCPIAQSEEYFTALKRLGKEVEMVRFPDCSHQFPRLGHPKMRWEYLTRSLAWFDRFLGA